MEKEKEREADAAIAAYAAHKDAVLQQRAAAHAADVAAKEAVRQRNVASLEAAFLQVPPAPPPPPFPLHPPYPHFTTTNNAAADAATTTITAQFVQPETNDASSGIQRRQLFQCWARTHRRCVQLDSSIILPGCARPKLSIVPDFHHCNWPMNNR